MERFAVVLGFAVALFSESSGAADFCISSSDDFRAAMAEVFSSPGPHHVRVVAGDYLIPDDIEFVGLNGLTIEGGYTFDCSSRAFGAQTTTLRGPLDIDRRPSFHAVGGGDLTISDVAFRDFTGAYVWADGATAVTRLDRVAFIARASVSTAAFTMNPNHGSISLNETLVDNSTNGCALDTHVYAGSGFSATGITVRNRAAGAALCISSDTAGVDLLIQDSITQADEGTDIVASAVGAVRIRASIYSSFTGVIDPSSSGNLPGPVAFENSSDELLRNELADVDQAARDSATQNPDASLDILGRPRTSRLAPDRGAFELPEGCDSIYLDGFDEIACFTYQRRPHSTHLRPSCIPAQCTAGASR
jgi:hypothetical protein